MAEKLIYTFDNPDVEMAILGPMNKHLKIIKNIIKYS